MTSVHIIHRRYRAASAALGLVLCAGLPLAATAAEMPLSGPWTSQVHGFATQGFAKSWNNNFVGESTQGSGALYEWGLSGTAANGPISISAQGLLRRVGSSDKGKARLDFGFLDYHLLDRTDYSFGLRYGRVKNPYGLFNDTRDVVFARPGIVMPNSVYFDTSGGAARNFLFSSDGGQAYAGLAIGSHYLTGTATVAQKREFAQDEADSLFGPGSQVTIKRQVMARLLDEWDAGTWRAAISYLSASLDFSVPFFGQGAFDYASYVASVERHGERYSLTAEYTLSESQQKNAGAKKNYGDGFYVQGDYRLTKQWTVMGRYDAQFSDRNDRDGESFAAKPTVFNPNPDRHTRYTHDFVAGGSWRPDAHWGVFAEHHYMLGTSNVPAVENPGGARKGRSELFLLMVGYHF